MRFENPTPLSFGRSFCPQRPVANSLGLNAVKTEERPSRCVLVVDDNADSRELTATLVQLSGHESKTASDGGEAIEQANHYQPDAILLDISLPDMSGLDVCRTIREQEWASEVPIIALSGWSGSDAVNDSKEAGFDAYLVKPVDPADLMEVLSTLDPKAAS